MKHGVFRRRLHHALRLRHRWLLLCGGLLILSLFQALALWMKETPVVVVPPGFRQGFWVQETRVSAAYMEEMGVFLSGLLLSVSPASAAYQRDCVLRHADPAHYGALKAQLVEAERLLSQHHASTVFRPIQAVCHMDTLTLELTGDFMTWVGQKQVSCYRETYELRFRVSRGQVLLMSFKAMKEKEG